MKKFILLPLFFLELYAHPHFFIDASIDIQKEKIIHTWGFDKINSRLLIFDFDTNKNNSFEKEEQEKFLQTHFDKLYNDNYNLFLDIDGEEVQALPSNKTIFIKNKQVWLYFELLISIKENGTICTIDPTLYFAYKLQNMSSIFAHEIQKSEHDYCIGVTK